MKELLAQQVGLAVALAGLAALVLLVLLFASARRRSARKQQPVARPATTAAPAAPTPKAKVDPAAPACRRTRSGGDGPARPACRASISRLRNVDSRPATAAEAEELLRKCILGAGAARHKATHAKARLALGDLAHAGGDPTTACEHWQIARALFHELRQVEDHAEAEQRMLRNGCPTDWVLTDF